MLLRRVSRSTRPARLARLVGAVTLTVGLGSGLVACSGDASAPDRTADGTATLSKSEGTIDADADADAGAAAATERRVLAISVDAFNPRALRLLGREGAPHLYRLFDQGAATLNARSQIEQTRTLPNHTSMVTGRTIAVKTGGHGVEWNEHRPGTTVQRAAGAPVESVFNVVRRAGLSSALFSTKTKFSIFRRSWPGSVQRSVIREERDGELVSLARRDLIDNDRAFTFLHLGYADQIGHTSGFMGPRYLAALQRIDRLVGAILRTVDSHPSLSKNLVVVLTSDHGGPAGATSHSDRRLLANYRVPFMIWGPGVTHDDLYDLNPTYADPGTTRPGLTGTPPIRNGDLANLATSILGLGPVPGSRFDVAQSLTAR